MRPCFVLMQIDYSFPYAVREAMQGVLVKNIQEATKEVMRKKQMQRRMTSGSQVLTIDAPSDPPASCQEASPAPGGAPSGPRRL